ncbi:MAG: peptidylprolyl isomerase [Patescibacteria group bacterium]
MAEKKKEAKKAFDGLKNKIKNPGKTSSEKKASGGGRIAELMANKVYMVIAVIVLLAVMMIGVFSVGIYKFGWNDNATMELSRIVPFPAFFVNGTPVTYAKYQDYNKAYSTYITEFYIKGEKKIDPNSDEAKTILNDAKGRVKELLVKNTIVKSEVKKRKIKYTQKELDDSFQEFVKRTGGDEEVKNNLKKYYGLTVERFKSEFFIDTFLSGKLQNAIQEDKSMNADAEKKANEVLAKVKAGEDFAELAKKYSEDTTAAKGGDLGSVKKGTLVPEFEDALWKLTTPGQTSELVKTVYGYHIIKLTAINGEERTASHILIKTKDFDTWMEEQVKNAKVNSWIK